MKRNRSTVIAVFLIISVILSCALCGCAPVDETPISSNEASLGSGTSDTGMDTSEEMTEAEKLASKAEPYDLEGEWETLAESAFEVKLTNKSSERTAVARTAAVKTDKGHLIYMDLIDSEGKIIHSTKQYGRGIAFVNGETPDLLGVLTLRVDENKNMVSWLMYYSFGDAIVTRTPSSASTSVSDGKAEPEGIAVRRMSNGDSRGGFPTLSKGSLSDESAVAFSREPYAKYITDLSEHFYREQKNGKTSFYAVIDSYTQKDVFTSARPGEGMCVLEPGRESFTEDVGEQRHIFDLSVEEIYEKSQNAWF